MADTRALDVRTILQTDDGHLVYAHYPGRFHRPSHILTRIAKGEEVEVSPGEYYFRTAPLFETAPQKSTAGSPRSVWGDGRPGQSPMPSMRFCNR